VAIKDKVTVAKGVKVPRGKEEEMREKKGGGSAGKYKDVSPKEFAGSAGGTSKYSFPIDTIARARNALARAHFAPDPEGIKRKVYKAYPELKERKMEREGEKPMERERESKRAKEREIKRRK